jgi:hypothetical protein
VDILLQDIRHYTIATEGLFLNADSSFDTKKFPNYCYKNDIVPNIDQNKRNGNGVEYIFDELLYQWRFVIERTHAWMDGFKAILTRFETNKTH